MPAAGSSGTSSQGPEAVPKKSLTGDNAERVDTRVPQVIYAVRPGGGRLFVGQQVDVYIEASLH